MALVALPPELRSICRKLTTTKVEHLPALLPSLLKDVVRCQEPLSAPQEAKSSDNSSEVAVLVHRLKTQISTLLNGRSLQGHFVGAALVKAVIESGGWECLQASGPWVSGLLSILQKKDPPVTKDMCIVALTKIYTLMHRFPTLVREIATPTLTTFATACLQILKPPASSKAAKAPYNLMQTVFEALSTLLPLYPTTLRQSAAKFKAETRRFVVPTSSDGILVPASLQQSSRRLVVRLHMTAPKGGDSTEWTKHLEGLIKTAHMTADQVFRAVEESWESTSGYIIQPVNFDAEPQGGSDVTEQLPPWTGVQAGSERMIGLLEFIADYLRCRTKVAVSIPISAIVDVTARISSIMPPAPGRERSEYVQMNPAVGREEKDELWTVFPDIQIAAMRLLLIMARRLEKNYVSIAQETLDQLLRMLESSYRLPQARLAAFLLVKEILCLCGPTMDKVTVEGLSLVIKSCCRDLLGAAGHLKRPRQQATTLPNGSKSKPITQNIDAFLSNKAEEESIAVSLSQDHIAAAEALLITLFRHVPQQHLPSSLRSRMLKTAILCRIRDAQVASVLHPSRDRSGRTPQVILPYLAQQFPRDESVELLRFNFRPLATGTTGDFMGVEDGMEVDEEEDEPQVRKPASNGFSFGQPLENSFLGAEPKPVAAAEISQAPSHIPVRAAETIQSPFLPQIALDAGARLEETAMAAQPSAPSNSLKRKSEDEGAGLAVFKRVEIEMSTEPMPDDAPASLGVLSHIVTEKTGEEGGKEEESDDESVHLNMELDSDDDEEE
ncbi:rRNA processing/ribosome biogenesis-domain-containing protein [Biscogniauxia mediterranea]|nr:rRNA processing/ribosome biogenesis-domain-containing protein [Biscogniauxia mediterranea]